MSATAGTRRADQGTRRARILAHLADYPDLTSGELARVISSGGLWKLLQDMQRKGLIVAATQWHPQQGRPVSRWRLAPPGTMPQPRPAESPEAVQRRLERDRAAARRRREGAAGASPARPGWQALPPGAACAGTGVTVFFPGDGESGAVALAICAGCPVREPCFRLAVASGEQYGIWGGVRFERRGQDRQVAS
jgi:WhiB family redox-sensing transcriptional regulator